MHSKTLDLIFNEGERLIPFVTHNDDEAVRHFSSYDLFTKIIERDIECNGVRQPTVLDIGFGCGYGCFIFSKILGVKHITGIDISYACKLFAEENYGARNIDFIISDAAEFLAKGQPFGYITSRGVLEHINNGLELVKESNYQHRLIIDVPYDEKAGNQHHVMIGITEDAFTGYGNYELFYEGLDGTIYDAKTKPDDVNMVLCVATSDSLPPVSEMFEFPIKPVEVDYIKNQMLARDEINSNASYNQYFFYENATELLLAVEQAIKSVDIVLDVGPGIVPMNYFRPKFHIMLEPFEEYVRILTHRFANDGSVFVLSGTAQDSLSLFTTNSVDTIFLLDVIEHLPKSDGINVLKKAEQIARRQVIVFTPLGFMPQNVHGEEKDAWGLSGTLVQQHLSGWTPEDFSDGWDFYICENYHKVDFRYQPLEKEYGAFWAIKTFFNKPTPIPESISDIRKPLPSEIELSKIKTELRSAQEQLMSCEHQLALTDGRLIGTQNQLESTQNQLESTQNQLESTQSQLTTVQSQLDKIYQNLGVRLLKKIKKYWPTT